MAAINARVAAAGGGPGGFWLGAKGFELNIFFF